MSPQLSRRSMVRLGLGAAAAAAVEIGSATSAGAAPLNRQMVSGSFRSYCRAGATTAWEVLYPPGYGKGAKLPVLICLHGTSGNEKTPEGLRFFDHAAVMAREGLPPFACVGVSGGDTWWHARREGGDSAAMVAFELVPLLARLGLDVRRPALYGLSMGGLGAINLAGWAGPSRLSSLVVSSAPFPASWDELDGAYDSPQDFAWHDNRTHWGKLKGLPVRIDIGDKDKFLADNLAVVPRFNPRPEFYVTPGDHEWHYWSRVALDQFRFVARHFD